jgi:hypothetical protein
MLITARKSKIKEMLENQLFAPALKGVIDFLRTL